MYAKKLRFWQRNVSYTLKTCSAHLSPRSDCDPKTTACARSHHDRSELLDLSLQGFHGGHLLTLL